MKKLIIALFLGLTSVAFAQDWTPNMQEAQALAAKENKNIILVFSGSDWCAPCIRLDKTVWQSPDFISESAKSWVLVKADFPKKKEHALLEVQKLQNAKLAEKYNSEGYFPLVVVLDKNGKVLGKTGFKNVPAAEYIAILKALEPKS